MKMIAKLLENKKIIASMIIIILFLFVVYAGFPFISAFFGALILAFIFDPLDKWLKKRFNISPYLSAAIIITISLIAIIIPLIFLVQGLIEQITILPRQLSKIPFVLEKINALLPFDIQINQEQLIKQIMPMLGELITPVFSNILHAFAILFLLFFLFYYFLIYSDQIKDKIYEIIPFNEKNKNKIIKKFKDITYATIIGTFFIAIIQGGLIALNFYLFGIPNALFWGFVAVILSFIPIVGTPVIWVPTAILLFISGATSKAIGIIIIGILISSIDNILRPIINQKYGKIHPLTSIIGIYIGITQFGIIGIFIGPLIVAYLILLWKMYKEEYMDKPRT